MRSPDHDYGKAPNPAWRYVRATGVVLLLIVATVCTLATPPAVWGRNLVLNTDRYVQTLSPIATNPGVQNQVITRLETAIENKLDIPALVQRTLPPRAAPLKGPIEAGVNSLVSTVVTRFVTSDAFPKLWDTVNRVAHKQVDYLLTGELPANNVVKVDSQDRLVLDLGPMVVAVKKRLVAAGLSVAQAIPPVSATFAIADLHGLAKARHAVRLLNTAATWLPWVALGAFALAVALSLRRRRTLIASGLCVVGAMLVLGLGLTIGRSIYLNQISGTQVPQNVASYLYDTVIRFLRLGIRSVLAAGLIVVAVAWVTGPSHSAVSVRTATSRVTGETRVGGVLQRHRVGTRVGIVAAALIVLVLWTNPSPVVYIWMGIIAVVLLLAVELLRDRHAEPAH